MALIYLSDFLTFSFGAFSFFFQRFPSLALHYLDRFICFILSFIDYSLLIWYSRGHGMGTYGLFNIFYLSILEIYNHLTSQYIVDQFR